MLSEENKQFILDNGMLEIENGNIEIDIKCLRDSDIGRCLFNITNKFNIANFYGCSIYKYDINCNFIKYYIAVDHYVGDITFAHYKILNNFHNIDYIECTMVLRRD